MYRCTVRIVFDRSHAAGNAVLITFEVDDPVFTLVSAAVMTNRNFTLVVTACLFEKRRKQRFLRLVVVISSNVETVI